MNNVNLLVCHRCKKPITDVAYVRVSGAIILQEVFDKMPPLYHCKEHADNYAKHFNLHADCWIDTLRDHGVELYNMTEILEKMKESQKKVGD